MKPETSDLKPSGSLPRYGADWNWSLQAMPKVVRERFEERCRLILRSRSSGRIHAPPGIVLLSGTSDEARSGGVLLRLLIQIRREPAMCCRGRWFDSDSVVMLWSTHCPHKLGHRHDLNGSKPIQSQEMVIARHNHLTTPFHRNSKEEIIGWIGNDHIKGGRHN